MIPEGVICHPSKNRGILMPKKTRIPSDLAGNPWHKVDPGDDVPGRFNVVIEIPTGSSNKYELDKKTGMLRLDRVLYSAVYYPANYGFIPQTVAEDGDPLDVLVLGATPGSSSDSRRSSGQVIPMALQAKNHEWTRIDTKGSATKVVLFGPMHGSFSFCDALRSRPNASR
jgi:hypothetical protein